MTRREILEEIAELWFTFPVKPYTPEEKIRAAEIWGRLTELNQYLYYNGPKPREGWKPSVPTPTGDERERLIEHWMEYMRQEAQRCIDLGLADEVLRSYKDHGIAD